MPEAQQALQVWRIGFLSPYSAELGKNWRAAFQQGLRDLGYVDGKNIVIEQRHANGSLDRLPDLASDLFRLKVDVVVTHGGVTAAQVATKIRSEIPVVFIANPDPIGAGLVASLARPGGRVTGISDQHSELVAKRLELLKETVPSLSRVAVLHAENPLSLIQLRDTQAAASVLRLTVVPVRTTGPGPEGIDAVFTTIRKGARRP